MKFTLIKTACSTCRLAFAATIIAAHLSASVAMAQQSPSDLPVDPLSSYSDQRPSGEHPGAPKFAEGRFQLPALQPPSISTDEVGNGRTPTDFRSPEKVRRVPLPERAEERMAEWNWTIAQWAAPNTFSNPRYFEDRMLERHGHKRFGALQPVAAGARFFATVPMLPYLMALHDPCDCEYTLGYFRPGTCVPAFVQRPPYDRRAMLMESAVVAGVMVGFP